MDDSRLTCDSGRIEQFLQQKLSDEEQTAFQLHLDDCDDCRRQLEATAAGDDIWSGVRDSLRGEQRQRDWMEPSDLAPDSSQGTETSYGNSAVLKLLAPTDDDRMLGRLGTYEVAGVIGSGGMGVVLKAFDGALNRYVAIKILAPHLGSMGAARRRFSREAQAAAAVVHDNVMEIHGVSDVEGLPYLVMPYVRGPSLQRRLDDHGPLAVVEILRIGMQAANGLAAAHAQGLVHRDIKPANILLADGVERVKLTDFGLARAADDASLTRTGIIAGTPPYMSPEQARGESIDQRSDLFSLGSVLYAMCTGRAPFRAETSYGILRRVTDDEPRPIREINPEIPEWLCMMVSRLMAKNPGDRVSSAIEVAKLLETCLAHVQQPTVVPLPKSLARPGLVSKFRHQSNLRIRVLVMLTTLALGLLAVFTLPGTAPENSKPKPDGDVPRGTLRRVDSERNVASINLGEADAVKVGMRFEVRGKPSVDAKDQNLIVKGTVEVIRVTGDHISEVRILKEDLDNKMAVNDTVIGIDKAPDDDGPGTKQKPQPAAEATQAQPAGTPATVAEASPKRIYHYPIEANGHDLKLACSPDGKLIAIAVGNPTLTMTVSRSVVSGDWNPAVEIMDVDSGKIIVTLKLTSDDEDKFLATEHISHVEATAIAFSPDGKTVAVGTNIGQLKLYHANTGELVQSFDDEKAKLADPQTPEKWKALERAMGKVESLAFSPNGRTIATCGSSFADFAEGFAKTTRLGFRGTAPGRLKMWDAETGTLKYDLVGHNNHAFAVAFSPDGNLLASAGRWSDEGERFGNGVLIWDAQTGTAIHRLIRTNANAGANSIAFSPDSKMLAMGTLRFGEGADEDQRSTGGLSLIHVSSGIEQWLVTVPGWAKPIAFLPEEKCIAVLCGGRSIRLLDTETGAMKHELLPNDSPSKVAWNDFAVAPQSGTLVVAGIVKMPIGSVEVWRTRAGGNIRANRPTSQRGSKTSERTAARSFTTGSPIKIMSCSEDGKWIAVSNGSPAFTGIKAKVNLPADWKPSADILDAESGKTVVSLKLTTSDEDAVITAAEHLTNLEVTALALSPDANTVAVGDNIGRVILFDARTGERLRTLHDEREKLAERNTPENWKSLTRAMGSVASLAFSPDGSRLAMCGSSIGDYSRVFQPQRAFNQESAKPGRLKVWDLKTGTVTHDLIEHSHASAVTFSPEKDLLASAGRGPNRLNCVNVWNARTGAKVLTIPGGDNERTHTVAFSPDGKLMAIIAHHFDVDKADDQISSAISVISVATGIMKWRQMTPGSASQIAFHSNAVMVLSGGQSMWLIHRETGDKLSIIERGPKPRQGGRWNDFAVVKHGHMWVTAGEDAEGNGTIDILDPDKPEDATPAKGTSN